MWKGIGGVYINLCRKALLEFRKVQSDQTSPGPGSKPGLATIMKKEKENEFVLVEPMMERGQQRMKKKHHESSGKGLSDEFNFDSDGTTGNKFATQTQNQKLCKFHSRVFMLSTIYEGSRNEQRYPYKTLRWTSAFT